MGLLLSTQQAQGQNRVDLPQEMIWWNHIFEIKFIEKTVLPTNRLTHHRRDSPLTPSAPENHSTPSRSKGFFNKLSQNRKCREISNPEGTFSLLLPRQPGTLQVSVREGS